MTEDDRRQMARLRALAGRLEVQASVHIASGNAGREEEGWRIQDDASAVRWAIEQVEKMEATE